jgi:hypothetical protein
MKDLYTNRGYPMHIIQEVLNEMPRQLDKEFLYDIYIPDERVRIIKVERRGAYGGIPVFDVHVNHNGMIVKAEDKEPHTKVTDIYSLMRESEAFKNFYIWYHVFLGYIDGQYDLGHLIDGIEEEVWQSSYRYNSESWETEVTESG